MYNKYDLLKQDKVKLDKNENTESLIYKWLEYLLHYLNQENMIVQEESN